MSIQEVQFSDRSKQIGLLLSLAYDNLQLITNELALYNNNDTNKTESLSFDINGNVKSNLASRIMDLGGRISI